MSKTLEITLGVDLSAYATIRVPDDTDLSDEHLASIATNALDDDNVMFEPDWDSSHGLRVVCVRDEQWNERRADVLVQPSYFDAGQALHLFVKGLDNGCGVPTLVSAAVASKLLDPPAASVTYDAHVITPAGRFTVKDIKVRLGATQDEKDLAFMAAFAQIGSIEYGPAVTTPEPPVTA